MQLSKNLSLAEMLNSATGKRKGILNIPNAENIDNMKEWAENVFQPIREHFGVAIHVISGYRSPELNKAVGGSKTSQHVKGQAGDIDNDNTTITNKQIFDWAKANLKFTQLIWEFGSKDNPDWVHIGYDKNNLKNEVLRAKKVNGKTIYERI